MVAKPKEKLEVAEGLIPYEKLSAYRSITAQIKVLEGQKKLLNEEIKKEMAKAGVDKAVTGDLVARVIVQDKSKTDPDKLVEILREKGLHDLIQIKYVPNEEKLEEALYNGRIAPADLEPAIIPNFVKTLRVDPIKKEKGDDD